MHANFGSWILAHGALGSTVGLGRGCQGEVTSQRHCSAVWQSPACPTATRTRDNGTMASKGKSIGWQGIKISQWEWLSVGTGTQRGCGISIPGDTQTLGSKLEATRPKAEAGSEQKVGVETSKDPLQPKSLSDPARQAGSGALPLPAS